MPALLTLVLLVAETIFLAYALPETRGTKISGKEDASSKKGKSDKNQTMPATSRTKRMLLLKTLGKVHFFFLVLFSGVEFTFTFLTFDRKFFLSCVIERVVGLKFISV